jgi:DNA (cytosine-5)-methyltransferase 1
MIKYIDLFAGVGGFHYGIEVCNRYGKTEKRNGKPNTFVKSIQASNEGSRHIGDTSKPNRGQEKLHCVYSNEYDKYANSVYRKHYGECDDRDIRTVKASEIPDHDLLVGGFPCQAFSVAGRRGGFEDTRGTLFFEIARIAKQKQPRLLLLENVKGLLSHDKGKTFRTILGSLDELGYDTSWQVLNSKDFGVPQNRERVFIVGHLRGTRRPEVFPLGGTNQKNIVQLNQPTHSNDRVYDEGGIGPTLNTMQGGRRQPKLAIPVLTPDRAEKRQIGRRFKTNGEPSFTLTSQDKHGVYDGMKIRRLTPIETERLQGFPDNWTAIDADGKPVSDTQRYKMMGNAVTTNVVTAIGKKLLEFIS